MKRPTFTPAQIAVSPAASDGSVVLQLRDARGNEQAVPLAAELRRHLGMSLISGPVADQAQTEPRPQILVVVSKTRAYQMQDGAIAIELSLGNGRAIHVLLPGLHADALVQQIREMQEPDGPAQ